MARGLEARVPFLDTELVELCARIPPSLKLRGLREQYVLRQALAGVLPDDIRWRRKRPLMAPLERGSVILCQPSRRRRCRRLGSGPPVTSSRPLSSAWSMGSAWAGRSMSGS
jgi:asparagine synthetase B (glutamine-hydrolysing)